MTIDAPGSGSDSADDLGHLQPSVTRHGPVVALDGPGSSGKSSVGAAAAARLGLRFCDTGLLYRAATFLALRRGVSASDETQLVTLVPELHLEHDAAGRLAVVTIDGRDVTAEVQSAEVDTAVSAFARVAPLRAALLERQRQIAAAGGIIMAGRDIGTVVLPDADVKLFLDASVEERARRRAEERGLAAGSPEALEILEQLRERDAKDSSRPVAPLRAAPDAVIVRTDGNTFETTVDLVVAAIRSAVPGVSQDVDVTQPASTGDASVAGPAASTAIRSAPAEGRIRSRRGTARVPIEPTPVATRLTPIIRIGSFVIRCLVRLFTRIRIEGDVGAIPRTGAVLIAANHASNADPVLVGGFLNPRLGRPINWMGKREVFDWPVVSWLARRAGVHPVERGAADVEAFRTATRILEAGHILAVFPEGTRSPDGRLQAAKDGVAVLAARSGATVVPIGIGDSDRLWPKGRLLPRFTRSVTLTVGTPFRLDEAMAAEHPEAAADRRVAKQAGTVLIMGRIAALLPARQRGVYAPNSPD